MKRNTMIAITILLILVMAAPVMAADFHDTMGEALASGYRMIDKNMKVVFYAGASEASDRDQLTVDAGANGIFQGSVRYQFSGATQVRFRVYSPKGTFSVRDSMGAWQFGTAGDALNISVGDVVQARLQPSTGDVYVNAGGWKKLTAQANVPILEEAGDFNGAGLIDYGVNLYAGAGAGSRVRLLPTRLSIEQKAVDNLVFCVEDFVCAIPAGATNLWIELNDAGGTVLSRNGYRTSLAWVTLSGDSFSMGPPTQESLSSSSPSSTEMSEPSSQSASSGGKRTSSAPALPIEGGTGGAKSSAAEASSKFEGVITSSQPSAKARVPSASSKEEISAEEIVQMESIPVAMAPHADAAEIYEIRREAESKPLNFGVIVYILLVAVVVAYLLIRPKKQ